jgi:hypothetical protein
MSWLGSVVGGLTDAGRFVVHGAEDGAKAVAGVAEDGAKAVASGAKDGAKAVASGVEDGWKSAFNDAKAAAGLLGTGVRALDAAKEQFGSWIDSGEKDLTNNIDEGRAWLRQHGGIAGQIASDQIGFAEGVGESLYGAGKGVVQLADTAGSLANPIEWAANPSANIARVKSTINTVETLGRISNLASPASWMTDPQGNEQLAGALWHSAATSFENDPSKFIGNAAGTIGTLFIPGADVAGVVGDVGKAAAITEDVGKAAAITEDVGKAATISGDVGKAATISGDVSKAAAVTGDASKAATKFPEGSFDIIDWSGYPEGVPKPQGPFRLVEGQEYDAARDAANKANSAIRKEQGLVGKPVQVHEIKPVKFGGSPTDPANKVILPRDVHMQQVTPWWNRLLRNITP